MSEAAFAQASAELIEAARRSFGGNGRYREQLPAD